MATGYGSPQGEHRGYVRRPHFRSLNPVRCHCANNQDRALGVTGYITTDPENISTILLERFDDYGLGTRLRAAYLLLREGIFSQDGHAWKRSRPLIQRQFVRVQQQSLGVFTPPVDELVLTLA
jgi:cytochrome P450